MSTAKISFDQLEIFGKFLALGYQDEPDVVQLSKVLAIILNDWEKNRLAAHENRILTNVIALTVENAGLFSSLHPKMKPVFKLAYMDNWRRSELIKKQVMAISQEITSPKSGPVLMIKGGLRLFDNLYPSISHRYMADLDFYFEDSRVLTNLSNAGYLSTMLDEFDLNKINEGYLEWHQTQNHHLPPIYNEKHPCSVEMHQHMVHLRAVAFYPSNPFGRAIHIPKLPSVMSPNPVDELILNLLHSKYGDMFTDYSNFRLRNVFEGYLLFKRLTQHQKLEVEEYFKSMGLTNDFEFWKLLCVKLFDAAEFDTTGSTLVKFKFFLHKRFGQSSNVNAVLYAVHFVYRMVFKSLWTAQGRKRFVAKLKDVKKRQRFLAKIKKIVGR